MEEPQPPIDSVEEHSANTAEMLRSMREHADKALESHRQKIGDIEAELSRRIHQIAEELAYDSTDDELAARDVTSTPTTTTASTAAAADTSASVSAGGHDELRENNFDVVDDGSDGGGRSSSSSEGLSSSPSSEGQGSLRARSIDSSRPRRSRASGNNRR